MTPERATYLRSELDQIKAWLNDPTADLTHEDRIELLTALQDLEVDLAHYERQQES